jgi:dihydroanticapsin dehydrogenase
MLVNNAAVFVLRGLEATAEEWRKSLDVNIVGTAFITKHVAPEISKAGGGAIVNLASISAIIAQPNFITYSTTKAAIAQMTRCLALDLAGGNIRVNAVCPGTIWTPQVERMAAEAGLDRDAAEADPEWGGKHLLGRMGHAREVANAILFLASDEASFITGECLVVDGGYTIT